MRNLELLDAFRVEGHPGGRGDHACGMFKIPHPKTGVTLGVIASSEGGWDHVSVSVTERQRCPNWPEMEYVRRMFFQDHECVIQIHAPIDEYVSGEEFGHPYCLHLWRPQQGDVSRPPRWMIGGAPPKQLSVEARTEGLEWP